MSLRARMQRKLPRRDWKMCVLEGIRRYNVWGRWQMTIGDGYDPCPKWKIWAASNARKLLDGFSIIFRSSSFNQLQLALAYCLKAIRFSDPWLDLRTVFVMKKKKRWSSYGYPFDLAFNPKKPCLCLFLLRGENTTSRLPIQISHKGTKDNQDKGPKLNNQ